MNGLIISIACIITSSRSQQLDLTNCLCFENYRFRNPKLMYFTEVPPKIGDIQIKAFLEHFISQGEDTKDVAETAQNNAVNESKETASVDKVSDSDDDGLRGK